MLLFRSEFFVLRNTCEMDEQYKGRILGWQKTLKSMVSEEGLFKVVTLVTKGELSSIQSFVFAWTGSAEMQQDLEKYEKWSDEILRFCSFIDWEEMSSLQQVRWHPAFDWVQKNLDFLSQTILKPYISSRELNERLYDLFYAVLRK